MICGFCKSELIKELTLKDILLFDRIMFNECCLSCYEDINLYDDNRTCSCPFCKKNLQKDILICEDCQNWKNEIESFQLKHDFLYEYNNQMKEYFQRYKFLHTVSYRTAF